MTERVALFAERGSRQVAEIAEAVRDAGGEPLTLDLRLGGKPDVSDQPTVCLADGMVLWDGIDFGTVDAVHIRCTTPRTLPTVPPVLNPTTYAEYRAGYLVEQAYQAATYAFFEQLSALGTLVVNPLTSAYIDHNSKGQFYLKLRANGFRAPRSLSTNCPDTALAFLDEVGELVMKPAIGIGSTRAVTQADRERIGEVALCPVLFQERIHGPTIRIHVVGDTMVLALQVHSEGLDSRTGTQSFDVIALDPDESAAIVRANRFMGLHYAAWDAILDAHGRLHYLDCNPGPYLGWLPPENRRFVFDQLAAYLLTYARDGSVAAAAAVCAFDGRD